MNIRPEPPAPPPPTSWEVELAHLDLRYEGFRLRDPRLEGRLLADIAQRGLQEALEGVYVAPTWILLNGFKRLRCARQLHIHQARFNSLGGDEAAGILQLLGTPKQRALGMLEQARFLDELKEHRGLSIAELAATLGRSKAWVSMRLGLLAGLSPVVRAQLFAGAFPVYSYLYAIRPSMRLNGVTGELIDAFVTAVSGHQLSVRQIEQLAHGCFRGPASFREAILAGNLALPLKQIEQVPPAAGGCTEFERVFLGDLELTQKYLQRLMGKSQDPRLASRGFFAQAHLLTGGLLSRLPALRQTLQQLHDRSGQA